jgi:hypothetical protein
VNRRTLLASAAVGLPAGLSGCLSTFDGTVASESGETATPDAELRFVGVYPDEVDRDFLDDEYLLVQNVADDAVDASGYVVEYPGDRTYRIEDLALEPGAQLAVLSRSGDDVTLASSPPVYLRYAGFGTESDTSVLGESGTVRLRDDRGTVVAEVSYDDFGCDGHTGTETGDGIECLH